MPTYNTDMIDLEVDPSSDVKLRTTNSNKRLTQKQKGMQPSFPSPLSQLVVLPGY